MMRAMAVLGLYALQNGFMGFERSGLFYGEFSSDRVRIPIACWLVRTSDAMILFDTGLSPRAVPGLLRNDPLARFTEEDLLVHRLDLVGLEPENIDMVVLSHLHYDHAGGAALFPKSELVVQKDEYSYAHYPASFFESFYYRKNFDLPGYRWRLLDGDTELLPGVTILRSDGHTPGHQSLLVELPETGPVILTGAPLAAKAEDDRATHARSNLSRSRSDLLGNRQTGAGRVSVVRAAGRRGAGAPPSEASL